jgi:hypothetical protein
MLGRYQIELAAAKQPTRRCIHQGTPLVFRANAVLTDRRQYTQAAGTRSKVSDCCDCFRGTIAAGCTCWACLTYHDSPCAASWCWYFHCHWYRRPCQTLSPRLVGRPLASHPPHCWLRSGPWHRSLCFKSFHRVATLRCRCLDRNRSRAHVSELCEPGPCQ